MTNRSSCIHFSFLTNPYGKGLIAEVYYGSIVVVDRVVVSFSLHGRLFADRSGNVAANGVRFLCVFLAALLLDKGFQFGAHHLADAGYHLVLLRQIDESYALCGTSHHTAFVYLPGG